MIHIFIRGDHKYRVKNNLTGQSWREHDGMEALACLADMGVTTRLYGPCDPLSVIDEGPLFDCEPIR